MLSAFQARKARVQPVEGVPNDSSKQTSSAAPVVASNPTEKLNNKPSSKRKPPGLLNDGTAKVKRKKIMRNSDKSTGYFKAPEVLLSQKNLVTIDQEDVIEMSDLEDNSGTGVLPDSATTGRRAWSPSQPFYDSSEDELEQSNEIHESAPPLTDLPSAFSSFIPEENVNFFRLSEEDIPGRHSGDATVLFLPLLQSMALVGVYSLTVLQGSVSICGALLGPSMIAHSVFAPRSSPVPVIESVDSDEANPSLIEVLPSRLMDFARQNPTVLLLEELRTGVQGLGRIIRTFEHAFQASSQQSPQEVRDLGITGVFVVRFSD
jgi:polynucleotide 5'-hydroxyl-kinase GRC3/NOL9